MYKYDVALSYAGEQKDYVASVYKLLKRKGISAYFAPAYQEELTGTDMTDEFYTIFHNQCLFIAAFVSSEYLQKKRTMAEAAIGQMRSREEQRNCLIPVYWGDARLPDFDPDINFLSADKPAEIVAHYLAEAVWSYARKTAAASAADPRQGTASVRTGGQASSQPHIYIQGAGSNIVMAGTINHSNIQCMNGEET